MKKAFIPNFLLLFLPAILFTSCGEDRSGEYYALVSTKTWMYETMQQNYLFYKDLPAKEKLNFFQKPEDFLRSAASPKDQKNGIVFSHVDSILPARVNSQYPTYGIEGALIRNAQGDNVVHILYTYPNSPASEVGLKRGDWILQADNQRINTSNFAQLITKPIKSYRYQIARTTPEGKPDTAFIDMPNPRIIREPSILLTRSISVNGKNAYYIAYNKFEEKDEAELRKVFADLPPETTDIILDLRYNPGGSVQTAVLLSTYLAPSEALGKKCTELIPNNMFPNNIVYNFDGKLLQGAPQAKYQNLYIITTGNTASASELVINCLRPYMKGRIFQVGDYTFGKNVAQSLFTDPSIPQLEFWLTTAYVSNSEGKYDYYENGLKPDFQITENPGEELGELGTEKDILLLPILHHLKHGRFPDKPEISPSPSQRSNRILYHPLNSKPKINQIKNIDSTLFP